MEATKGKKEKASKTKKDAEMEQDEPQAEGAMITALCWVSRGFAKAVIDEDEQMAETVGEHSKLIKKLAK